MLLYNLWKAGCEVGFFVFRASRMALVRGGTGCVADVRVSLYECVWQHFDTWKNACRLLILENRKGDGAARVVRYALYEPTICNISACNMEHITP